jgi:hypothetical protein
MCTYYCIIETVYTMYTPTVPGQAITFGTYEFVAKHLNRMNAFKLQPVDVAANAEAAAHKA